MSKQELIETYVEKAAGVGIDPVEARQEAEQLWDLLHNLRPQSPEPTLLVSPLAAEAFLPKRR